MSIIYFRKFNSLRASCLKHLHSKRFVEANINSDYDFLEFPWLVVCHKNCQVLLNTSNTNLSFSAIFAFEIILLLSNKKNIQRKQTFINV